MRLYAPHDVVKSWVLQVGKSGPVIPWMSFFICIRLFTTKVEHTTARQTDILQIYNKSKPKKRKK